jgi:hypothetical protein
MPKTDPCRVRQVPAAAGEKQRKMPAERLGELSPPAVFKNKLWLLYSFCYIYEPEGQYFKISAAPDVQN